jgi:hypothetical protein
MSIVWILRLRKKYLMLIRARKSYGLNIMSVTPARKPCAKKSEKTDAKFQEFVDRITQYDETYLFGNKSNMLSEIEMHKIKDSLRVAEVKDLEINDKNKCKFTYNRVCRGNIN